MAASQPERPLHFESAQQWRRWLANNGSKMSEVWLEIRRQKSGRPGIFYEDAVSEALCFGWIDGKMKSVDEHIYVLRFSPRRKKSIWSKSNRERAERLIAAGKMEKGGLEAIEQARINGRWTSAYSAQEVPEVPEDLEQELARNPLARENFLKMSNSHRLMYLRWVLEAKRSQTRERRIAEVLKRAEQNLRPG